MMDANASASASTVGARLLRSDAVASAGWLIDAEIAAHVAAALNGPVGTALAATSPVPPVFGDDDEDDVVEGAQHLLGAAVPRMFLATGAALTIAYTAVSEGDETRAAAALLAAGRQMFADDPLGQAAVSAAARPAIESLSHVADEPGGAPTADAAAEMQRRVAGDMERLDRAYLSVAPHLHVAALSSYSWKQATGGAGPLSGALHGPFGPFLDALVRWAFYVEAALDGVRRDDWARAGAALIAARRVTTAR